VWFCNFSFGNARQVLMGVPNGTMGGTIARVARTQKASSEYQCVAEHCLMILLHNAIFHADVLEPYYHRTQITQKKLGSLFLYQKVDITQ
jgi:hypothetical protein